MAFAPRVQPYAINSSGDIPVNLIEDLSTRSLNTVRIGGEAGKINSGTANAFVGYQSGYSMQNGSYMTCIGYQSGYAGINNQDSVFIGAYSGNQTNYGNETVYVGYKAGELSKYSTQSVGIGAYSLRENTSGNAVVAVGYRAGEKSLDGGYNTFIGAQAGQDNRSGFYNTMGGFSAGRSSFLGNFNTYFGAFAGYSNSYGSGNTFIGYSAGATLSQGDCNIGRGAFSFGNSSGSGSSNQNQSQSAFNIIIGNQTECYNSYSVLIGNQLYNDENNSIIIGNLNSNQSKNTVILGSNVNIAGIQSFTDPFNYSILNITKTDALIKYNISNIEYDNLLSYSTLNLSSNLINNINGPNDLISKVYTSAATNNLSTNNSIDIRQYILNNNSNYFIYQGFSIPLDKYQPNTSITNDTYFPNVLLLMHTSVLYSKSVNNSSKYTYDPISTGTGISFSQNYSPFNNTNLTYYNSLLGTNYNGSIYFNGTANSYIKYGPSSGIISTNSNYDYTIELWLYLNDTTKSYIIFGSIDKSNSQNNYYSLIYNNNDSYIELNTYSSIDGTYRSTIISTPVSIKKRIWYNIALVKIGDLFSLYLNGVSVIPINEQNITFYDIKNNFYIGWNGNSLSASTNNAYNLNGYITEFRVTLNTGRYNGSYTVSQYPYPNYPGYSLSSSAVQSSSYYSLINNDILNLYVTTIYNQKNLINYLSNQNIEYYNYYYTESIGNEYAIATTNCINNFYLENSNISVPIYFPKLLSYPIVGNQYPNVYSNLDINNNITIASNLNNTLSQDGVSLINYIINSNVIINIPAINGYVYNNSTSFIYQPYLECITSANDNFSYLNYFSYSCNITKLINIGNQNLIQSLDFTKDIKIFTGNNNYFNDKLYINSNILNIFRYNLANISNIQIINNNPQIALCIY